MAAEPMQPVGGFMGAAASMERRMLALETRQAALEERLARLERLEQHPATALGEITTAALGDDVLKGAGARAGRDWCNKHGVPLRPDGKLSWARIDDVRRALLALPTERPAWQREAGERLQAAKQQAREDGPTPEDLARAAAAKMTDQKGARRG